MMIINDGSRVINKLEASLTDDARVIIYDHHMLIEQATDDNFKMNIWWSSDFIRWPLNNQEVIKTFNISDIAICEQMTETGWDWTGWLLRIIRTRFTRKSCSVLFMRGKWEWVILVINENEWDFPFILGHFCPFIWKDLMIFNGIWMGFSNIDHKMIIRWSHDDHNMIKNVRNMFIRWS